MRVLAFADESPPVDAAELVALNQPDVVVTLGDLPPDSIAPLGTIDPPRLGVHGNHDGEGELTGIGIRDLHLARLRSARAYGRESWRTSGRAVAEAHVGGQ
jgi:hypothetical protein